MKTLVLLLFPMCIMAQKEMSLTLLRKFSVSVPEPSDMALSSDQKSLFIVSDQGGLFETDLEGKVLRKYTSDMVDAEGVYCDASYVWVLEERTRLIKKFDRRNLNLISSRYLPYEGGRNKSYESILKLKNGNWMVITERDPIWMIELTPDFTEVSRKKWNWSKDISSATLHNEKLWLLSDEDTELLCVDPETFQIEKRFRLPVLNPEGFCFINNSEIFVLSDDLQKIYVFSLDPRL